MIPAFRLKSIRLRSAAASHGAEKDFKVRSGSLASCHTPGPRRRKGVVAAMRLRDAGACAELARDLPVLSTRGRRMFGVVPQAEPVDARQRRRLIG